MTKPNDTQQVRAFDPTKPVETRDGRKARIICTDRVAPLFPIVALVMCASGEESIRRLTPEGRDMIDGESAGDLVNAPERTSTWQNVYQYSGNMGRINYATKEEAKKVSRTLNGHLGYLRRNYEDGKFVSVEFEPVCEEERLFGSVMKEL